jgi:N-glycosylase/DNA lyase
MINGELSPQIISELVEDKIERLVLPGAEELVLPSVRWGKAEAFYTPAYWATQYWYATLRGHASTCRWGTTLTEEIVACLLGGYGITHELNRAAFDCLRRQGLLEDPTVTETELIAALSEPLELGERRVRYRFPNQKGRFVSKSLCLLRRKAPPAGGGDELRSWLMKFPGIGIKTASWIARNVMPGYQCAVIDVHVFRAGVIMGIFSPSASIPREYRCLEARFLEFSKALDADPTKLDLVIWSGMRKAGTVGVGRFNQCIAAKN